MTTPVLGYWDLRGLTEPIRFLLHYQGVKFEDKRYQIEKKEAWFDNDKYNLGLDFPNLPYLIDGSVKLTQSTTILRYLARKYDLTGKSEDEKLRAELAEQQFVDFRMNLSRLAYNPEFETLKDDFIQKLPEQVQLFSKFLGDREYFAGKNITYVDFLAYEIFELYRLLEPNVLNGFKNLEEFQDRIENLSGIQKYLKSSTYKRWPVFGPIAQFGGKGEEPKKEKSK